MSLNKTVKGTLAYSMKAKTRKESISSVGNMCVGQKNFHHTVNNHKSTMSINFMVLNKFKRVDEFSNTELANDKNKL